jgi:hypothetical protein
MSRHDLKELGETLEADTAELANDVNEASAG